MKKIGNTSTGSVIVEMTSQEYAALTQLQGASTAESISTPGDQAAAATMSHTAKVAYVSDRLSKMNPKKREGVIRSIETMFQHNGGISKKEVDKIISALEKRKLLSISSDGKVTFPKS